MSSRPNNRRRRGGRWSNNHPIADEDNNALQLFTPNQNIGFEVMGFPFGAGNVSKDRNGTVIVQDLHVHYNGKGRRSRTKCGVCLVFCVGLAIGAVLGLVFTIGKFMEYVISPAPCRL